MKSTNIIWQPPEPRSGLAGQWDKFVGPGATAAELWLQFLPVVLPGLALLFMQTLKDWEGQYYNKSLQLYWRWIWLGSDHKCD